MMLLNGCLFSKPACNLLVLSSIVTLDLIMPNPLVCLHTFISYYTTTWPLHFITHHKIEVLLVD